jgi:hypothetical protein
MKFGTSNSSESQFPFWILPDKPMGKMVSHIALRGGYQEIDKDAWLRQTEQIRGYLGDATKGQWMENNGRFYFELEEDFEMFKTMCALGWN